MTKINFPPTEDQIFFPKQPAEASQRVLDRLYEQKATLEALIESLEAYARCRMPAPVIPLRGN